MNDRATTEPVRDVAITLMRSALALLDHVGEADVAAALQNAIDIAKDDPASKPS